jgi:hypothetical protein
MLQRHKEPAQPTSIDQHHATALHTQPPHLIVKETEQSPFTFHGHGLAKRLNAGSLLSTTRLMMMH